MGPRNNAVVGDDIMNGLFLVKAYSSWLKGAVNRKCHVHLLSESGGRLVKFLISSTVESERSVQDDAEIILLKPKKWLMYLSQTGSHRLSLILVNTSKHSEYIVLEAGEENIPVLQIMEEKLREFLRVVSYDIKVKDVSTKNKLLFGTLHITRDKLILITGHPPNHATLVDYKFASYKNGVTLTPNEGLGFIELPNITVLSDQIDDIWKTIQGCIEAVGFCETTSGNILERLRPTVSLPNGTANVNVNVNFWSTQSANCADKLSSDSLWSPLTETDLRCSSKTQYVYYNLPKRPCKYLYMNLPDKMKAPHINRDYINIFHKGSIYQNCWRSCTKAGDDALTDKEVAPPRPPKEKPPPLPPKPRNRPPNSPLPPLPPHKCNSPQPPLPRRPDVPPSLPLPRLPEAYMRKEIQYVVYSSKPVIGQMYVIQVVFFQKNDFATLERIKKLEKEASYQVLKPLPDCINVDGDLWISIQDIGDCCTLKSEKHQVIEREIVKDAILQSCWVIIEFHLEHNGSTKRNFHSKIAMRPKSARPQPKSSRVYKDVQISTTFLDVAHNGLLSPTPLACSSLKGIGVRKYLDVCSMMDIPCALHNDWTGLAGEIGLTVDEVFKIQSKACFPNFSPTNEVLNVWSQRQSRPCNVDEFKEVLKNLQRFDVLETLEGDGR